MEKLGCLFCRRQYPLDMFFPFCPSCHEPLLFSYPSKKRIFFWEKKASLEKFLDFLPLSKINLRFSLGEGNTSLIELSRLRKKRNLPALFAKNETVNPTHSFKDRGTSVAVQKAISLGIKRIGTVSTGNMASSTAAYGAKAGLETYLFLKEGSSTEKIVSTGMHGPFLLTVKGDYGQLFSKSFALGKKYDIYFANSVDPLRIEGYKPTGYEIFLQLEGRTPQFIFVPVSSGGHLIGLMRAFLDLKEEGFTQHIPTFVGVQAQGCCPIARAFASGKSKFTRIKKAVTVAHAISNPAPPGGNIVLKMMQENKGIILAVSDREILDAQRELAELEGILCDPASATTLAGLIKLSRRKKFKTFDRIVLVITGSGLKDMDVLKSHKINLHQTSLPNLEKAMEKLLHGSKYLISKRLTLLHRKIG